jgi:hypothetical protein
MYIDIRTNETKKKNTYFSLTSDIKINIYKIEFKKI